MTYLSVTLNHDLCACRHATKNPWHHDAVDRPLSNYVWNICILISLESCWKACCSVTITAHAISRHFLIWMPMLRQPVVNTLVSWVFCFKKLFYWWSRQRIHSTLFVVNQYLRLKGNKTIPDLAEPHLELFYLPSVGVVDSYNPA